MASSGSPLTDATAATKDGLDHLQNSAIELIGATRSFLDAAEIAIQNPDVVPQVVKLLSMLAKVPPITDDLISDDPSAPDETDDDNVVNFKSV